jgi:selenocysteine lyase/cysteine desulfurase
MKSLTALRRAFAHTGHAVFFDHASYGPLPKKARQLIDELAARYQQLDRTIDQDSFNLLRQIKRDFARIIHTRGDEVSFVPNTTTGTNLVLLGLALRRGERIILPRVEFPSLSYPVLYLARRQGLQVEMLHCPDGFYTLDSLKKALRRKGAAVLATSWVQYFNGYRYDVDEIVKLCHEYGVFVLLDGMQGIGAVPLDAKKSGVDAVVCGAAKWLFGSTGGGFMYLDPQAVRRVTPASISWLSADWGYSFGDLQRLDRPLYTDGRFFEWGTYPYYNLRLAQAGLELILAAGVSRTYRQICLLLDQLMKFLDHSPYVIASSREPQHRSAILSFTGPAIGRLHQYLTDHKFRTSLREQHIRVAPHFYNTPAEMRKFIAAIKKFPG